MRQDPNSVALTLGRAAKKFFLSAFVIFTFLVYAVHERLAGPTQAAAANGLPAAPAATASAPPASNSGDPATQGPAQAASPTAQAQPTQPAPVDTAAPNNSAPATNVPPTAAPAAQPTVVPASPTAAPASPTAAGQYKDGQFTGPTVDAFYGYVQVQAVIQGGQIADVKFLQYPSDRQTSRRINSIAMPYLTQEAVQAQSANVDIVSGATLTSQAFAESLQAALQSAVP